jgi:hypothetical protein
LAKLQRPKAITRQKIIGPEQNVNLICNSSLYTHIKLGDIDLIFVIWVYNDELQIKFTYIDLIFGIWVYNDELQIKFTFRSGPMLFGRVNYGLWTLKFGQKLQSPKAITRPKIIGPEQNVNLICNSSLYTHMPKIKSISPNIAKKVVTTKYLTKFQSPRAITRDRNKM